MSVSLINEVFHPVAMFREEESYKSLKLAMSDICAEVEDLELLTVGGENFPGIPTRIQTMDLEIINVSHSFLSTADRILSRRLEVSHHGNWRCSASSTHACILVQVLCWGNNGTLPSNGRLTIQLRMAHRQLKITMLPQTKRKFNISNPPLLPTIPLSRVVTDNLHLFLCVSDVLIDLLVEDAMRQDSLKMSKLSNFDRGK